MNRNLLFVMIAASAMVLLSCSHDEKPRKVLHADRISIEPFKGVRFEMVFVEGGTFYMGSQSTDESGLNYDRDAREDESPVHKVTVDGYYIATTEVTQKLWRHVTGRDGFNHEWGNQFPAYNISYAEALDFIGHLNHVTGLKFRLPTEAEWEFAARGGVNSQGFKYSGSNNINDVAWFYENSNDQLHPVAEKNPNELGLYDMSGNVREWCSDWAEFYTPDEQINPVGPEWAYFRVLRGGSRFNSARLCRCTFRLCRYDYNDDNLTGFRLVLDTAEVNKMLRLQK